MDVRAFGSEFTHQPQTGWPKSAHDEQADVTTRCHSRGAGKEPAEILSKDPVFRMVVECGIEAGGVKY
jgi:hypothetical protein